MLLSNVNIGDTVSFEVYPSTLLGNQFKDVVVLSFIDAETARLLGYDFMSMHANIFPTLPEGTPDNPTQYNYMLVRMQSGQRQLVGIPWVDESTLTSRTTTAVFVEVPNAGNADVPNIINALAANGYRSISVRVGSPSS